MIKNSKGQGVVEAVLILVIVVGLATLIANYFRKEELMHKMVSGPWVRLSGMLQNGSWASPKDSMALHPSNHARAISLAGERIR